MAMAMPPVRALIVEDNEDDAFLMLRQLRKHGLEAASRRVDNARDLRAALREERWDVILCDFNLPDLNALDALAIVKETGLDLPFIIVSGTIGDITAVEAMRSGAHDFVMKSNLARLVPAIEREIREAGIRAGKRQAEQERARAYEEAKASAERALQAVEARDEFLSIASHELKTPVTSLHLQTQTLVRLIRKGRLGELPAERLTSHLENYDRQLRRLTGLVEELLDVSQLNSGKLQLCPERVHLAQAVREVESRFSDIFEHSGCQLQLEVIEDVVGDWDRARIEQVIGNLISNAIKYSPGKPIQVRIEKRGDTAVLTIHDFGMGIARQDLERIFGLFERAVPARNFGGLGIGLYIARQILKAHGGRIHAESQPGQGSSFVVELPLANAASTELRTG